MAHPRPILAAGGLVEHVNGGGRMRIAVVHRTRYHDREGQSGDWVLPKGKQEPGETLEATAVREVAEEVGVRGRIIGPSFPCEYEVNGVPKAVIFFRMIVEDVAPSGHAEVDTSEVREVVWFEPDKALDRLTYDTERRILRQAYNLPK